MHACMQHADHRPSVHNNAAVVCCIMPKRFSEEGIDNSNNENSNENNKETSGKKPKMTISTSAASWGDWMGSWKVQDHERDDEAERIDRQKAAFGGDMVGRIKDLNVLIVGCGGVGVETAKNLILSNIGGCLIYDPTICQAADRGANFYITNQHVASGSTTRAQASIEELKSLNPYCRVDVVQEDDPQQQQQQQQVLSDDWLTSSNILNTHKGLAAVVVTQLQLLSPKELFRINETCRRHHIAFLLAINHGVTSSLFSDFGTNHTITDATGEPTATLAVANVEVLQKSSLVQIDGVKDGETVVVVTVAQVDHGLDDGDAVILEDMRGETVEAFNGKQLKVKRVAIQSPVSRVCSVLLKSI